jgi:hypothetical protein
VAALDRAVRHLPRSTDRSCSAFKIKSAHTALAGDARLHFFTAGRNR